MYQSITLVGNLGGEVEMKYTPSGAPVANFNLAVNKSWTDAQGEKKEKTSWFRITVWRAQAEICANYIHKGSKVLVIGEVEEARPWTDKDGNNRATIEVTAQTVKFLDGRPEGATDSPPKAVSNPAYAKQRQSNQSVSERQPELSDTDIPF